MVERFIDAAKDGYMDILREGTRKDLNSTDDNGMSATLWAAHNGNLEALRLIVGREGDVDKADYLGKTALLHAVVSGHMSVVSYLVHWGCNVYAMDNDLHSALDLAYLYERHEIVRFLDAHLAEKQAKNPKHVTKMKEEAMKVAEQNIKRYKKLIDQANREADKESRKQKMEREQHIRQQNGITEANTKSKHGIIYTITNRIKSRPKANNSFDNSGRRTSSTFSAAAGIHSATTRPKVSDLDDNGKRTLRSINAVYVGPTPEVLYVAGDKKSQRGELIYRARSESDLPDSGTDTYWEEQEDEENNKGILNRTEFGSIAFKQKYSFLNSIHSFDDSVVPSTPGEINSNRKLFSEEYFEVIKSTESNAIPKQPLPWDQDDVENLDDDEDRDVNELSSVSMFLWSCGLASYLHIFLKEKIDMQVLTGLTDSELKELGLQLGPRKKLLEAIAKRKAVLETPRKITDTYL